MHLTDDDLIGVMNGQLVVATARMRDLVNIESSRSYRYHKTDNDISIEMTDKQYFL